MAKKEGMPEYSYGWWMAQIQRDELRLRDKFWNYADKVVKKYKDKREDTAIETRINLFWTNVGIMKAALYARPPKPMVERTWKDFNDNIGRVASLIMQRCLSYDLLKNTSPMSEALKLAVEDRLVPGLGMVWNRYEVETRTYITPEVMYNGVVYAEEAEHEEIVREEVVTDYVPWRDIIYPSARVASEVWYIGRKLYKTREEVAARFGKEKADLLSTKNESEDSGSNQNLPKNFMLDKVVFYEIWCRKTRKVYWVSPHYSQGLLDEQDDPLELENFYPCPMPLMATHTTDDYLPRPDYYMVRDQYDALNTLNTRISLLESALKVIGVYNKKNSELKRLLSDAMENDMVPVDNWAMLAEAGGLKGQVDWFPIEMVANVLEILKEQKAAKIEEIYMLTGISDIMRGTTNPRETLGAQEIKAQYSSVRLQYLQDEVAVFAREALVIKGEIISKHFQPESIIRLSQIDQTPDAQYAEQAIALLKDSAIADFRIDINEESLSLPDYNREKDKRIEFLTSVGQFISQAAAMTEAVPAMMPFLIQIIRWVASGMRGSNEIQGVLDQAFNMLQRVGTGQQQQDPMKDPKVIQEQIKAQAAQAQQQGKHSGAMQLELLKQKGNAGEISQQTMADLTVLRAELESFYKQENLRLDNRLKELRVEAANQRSAQNDS